MFSMPAFYQRTSIRLAAVSLLLIGFCMLALVSCQSKLLYYPRDYPTGTSSRWQQSFGSKGKVITYQTGQGQQRAFLQGKLNDPEHLWIACGGNATVALDWSEWIQENASPNDAWLLFDMPGYGDCDGSPNPSRIQESLTMVMPLAFRELGWGGNENGEKLRFFGHSLGCAVVLIAAEDFDMPQGILLAPFTSTMEMADLLFGLPIGFMVTHRFNNIERVDEVAKLEGSRIFVFHGSNDRVIPASMSREIKNRHPSLVNYIEISGADHNTLHQSAKKEIAETIRELSN